RAPQPEAFPPGPGLHRESHARGDDDAEDDKEHADRARKEPRPNAELLPEDGHGKAAHPYEAHRSRDEEDEHEQPAAADAIEGMAEPHAQRTQAAAMPVVQDESRRGGAVGQADLLGPGDLPHSG